MKNEPRYNCRRNSKKTSFSIDSVGGGEDDSGSEYQPDNDNEDVESEESGNEMVTSDHEDSKQAKRCKKVARAGRTNSADWKERNQKKPYTSDSDEQVDPDFLEYIVGDVIRDSDIPGLFIRKLMKSNLTKTGMSKQNDRVYNSFNYCAICCKMIANFSQHILMNNGFKHRASSDIREIKEEKNLKQKKRLVALLRNKFNHMNNIKNIDKNSGEIILDRRPTSNFRVSNYGPCPHCLAWLSTKGLWKHQTICPGNPSDVLPTSAIRTQSATLCHKINPSASKMLIKEVLDDMPYDRVGTTAKKDKLIVSLGNQWMDKNFGNELNRRKYTSQIMRLCAKLLVNLRQLNPLENDSMWDYLQPQHFQAVVGATLLTTAPEMDDEEELEIPSNSIKLGFDIKRMANIKIALAIENGQSSDKQDAEEVLKLMGVLWGTKVTNLSQVILNEKHSKKAQILPDPGNIKRLNEHLNSRLEEIDYSVVDTAHYLDICEVLSAKLVIYNRRTTGEIESIR